MSDVIHCEPSFLLCMLWSDCNAAISQELTVTVIAVSGLSCGEWGGKKKKMTDKNLGSLYLDHRSRIICTVGVGDIKNYQPLCIPLYAHWKLESRARNDVSGCVYLVIFYI